MLYLALKNIYTQKRKTLVIGGIFFITTFFIFFLLSFYASIDTLLLKKFLSQKGHLFIQSSQYVPKETITNSYSRKIKRLTKSQSIFIHVPFAEFSNFNGSAIGQIRTPFKEFKNKLASNPQGIILSSMTADQLEASINDDIYITSQTANKVLNTISLKVLDIATHIDTNIISLNIAKELIDSRTLISGIYILLNNQTPISEQEIEAIEKNLPRESIINSWNQFLKSPSVKTTKAIIATIVSAFLVICFIIVGCIQGNHIWLNIQLRKKEIGILKAIGASNYKLSLMFLFEGILIASIFSGLAVLFGIMTNIILNWLQLRITFGLYLRIVIAPNTTLTNVIICFVFPVITSIFWSMLPSIKIRKMYPREIPS